MQAPRLGRSVSDDVQVSDAGDEAALVAVAQRDRRAFAPLYDRYFDPIYRYCYRRLGNHDDAADAASLVFVRALAALPRYRHQSFRGWLFAIAHNVLTDSYRRARPTASLTDAWDVIDGEPSPEQVAIVNEERRSLRAILSELTPDQRDVIELRLAGLTGAEIAESLGRTPNAVNGLQFRAVARLRQLFGTADTATPKEHRDG